VTAAVQTHTCPGECRWQLPPGVFVCRWCWSRLPVALRDAITASHLSRDPDAHVEAMLAALAWYREEPEVPPSGSCSGADCGGRHGRPTAA